MKKFISLILVLMLCMAVAACSDPSPAATEAPVPTETVPPEDSPYDAIIAEYAAAVKDGLKPAEMMERGLNYLLAEFLAADAQGHAGYAVTDLDGDGKDELVFAADSDDAFYKGIIFKLFTVENGELMSVVESGERDRWYWAGDGKLYNAASGGAAETDHRICSANDLSVLDEVKRDSSLDPDAPWFRFAGGEWKSISEDEANAAIAQMEGSVTRLDLTLFG